MGTVLDQLEESLRTIVSRAAVMDAAEWRAATIWVEQKSFGVDSRARYLRSPRISALQVLLGDARTVLRDRGAQLGADPGGVG